MIRIETIRKIIHSIYVVTILAMMLAFLILGFLDAISDINYSGFYWNLGIFGFFILVLLCGIPQIYLLIKFRNLKNKAKSAIREGFKDTASEHYINALRIYPNNRNIKRKLQDFNKSSE